MENKSQQTRLISTPTRTAEIMKRYQLTMKKSLGQNFLVEPNILERMVEAADIGPDTTVIEIGPGIGSLTEFLARSAKEVLAFEIDARFVEILQETLSPYDNVRVVQQDILKVDFESQEYEFIKQATDLIVVANLPYYITTPIIMHLLQSQLPFRSMVMLMQKEVAERMTAEVGTKAYNSLTVAIQRQMSSQLAFVVPRTVFIPKPNVDSAVLKLSRLNQPRIKVDDALDFEKFVKACFIHRRKTLWNNLKTYANQHGYDIEKAFQMSGIEAQRRAESLSLEDFSQLYHELITSNR